VEWRSEDGVEWLEARLPGARAVFSTRRGGVSAGPFAGLNLGAVTDDERAAVLANRGRLGAALGIAPERIAIGYQVHGAELAVHEAPQDPSPFASPGAPIPRVDGHVVEAAGMAALVLVADCLPVALAGPGGAAILHCGWRGLAAGILARGAAAVAATDAAIGPAIGPCCYEVGEEVLERFDGLDGVADGRMLDLAAVAERQLRAAGVERVAAAGACTSCDPHRFFSHRRDAGLTGRQAGLVLSEGS